ncbi:hypothetical protein GCM10007856_30260 [Azospirillum oryzae]|nr:hypothetical protein GCM10007856_30260 [Azospirillum oryzae]
MEKDGSVAGATLGSVIWFIAWLALVGGRGAAPVRRVAEADPMPVRLTDFPGSFPTGIYAILPTKILNYGGLSE